MHVSSINMNINVNVNVSSDTCILPLLLLLATLANAHLPHTHNACMARPLSEALPIRRESCPTPNPTQVAHRYWRLRRLFHAFARFLGTTLIASKHVTPWGRPTATAATAATASTAATPCQGKLISPISPGSSASTPIVRGLSTAVKVTGTTALPLIPLSEDVEAALQRLHERLGHTHDIASVQLVTGF